jgi:hypothetical protein
MCFLLGLGTHTFAVSPNGSSCINVVHLTENFGKNLIPPVAAAMKIKLTLLLCSPESRTFVGGHSLKSHLLKNDGHHFRVTINSSN